MAKEFNIVIIRLSGEIWIKKGWTRRWYLRRLMRNMKAALERQNIAFNEMIRRDGRIFLRTDKALEAAEALARVFGISSVSPALEIETELDAIVNGCLFLAKKVLSEGDSFAVRCRHVGEHSYTSQEVCTVLGHKVLERFAHRGVRVNLDNPDVRLGVEVRRELGFVFADTIKGVGGFPLGVQGRLVGLLSGGLDSAVAYWLAMRRGCLVIPLYFDNEPYTDKPTTERAVKVAKILSDWAFGFPQKLYIAKHGKNLEEIIKGAPRRLTCLLCKRLMYRVAEKIADNVGAEGLVTGEAIGEQASQTLRNLRVLDEAAERYPVHRPLLGFDKAETERLARKIGTYEVSARTVKGCEGAPHKPATKAKLEEVLEAEDRLNIEVMVKRCVDGLRVLDL